MKLRPATIQHNKNCFAVQARDQPSVFQVGLVCGCTNRAKDHRFYQVYNASFVFKSRVVVNPPLNAQNAPENITVDS